MPVQKSIDSKFDNFYIREIYFSLCLASCNSQLKIYIHVLLRIDYLTVNVSIQQPRQTQCMLKPAHSSK